ncbi:protein TsetseEP-like [Dreissena polymorpha]|uniref:protein TsetseEP-like n=1 Tax=Dreissena polymorpha TaxID=45954 RepID=UPI002263E91B|nr:protein TsetseEP-like [Dreissena polymorpha]
MQGQGNRSREAEPLTDEDIDQIWGDVKLRTTSEGDEFLEFHERQTKTRTGENLGDYRKVKPKMFDVNSPRDPIAMYKAYSAKPCHRQPIDPDPLEETGYTEPTQEPEPMEETIHHEHREDTEPMTEPVLEEPMSEPTAEPVQEEPMPEPTAEPVQEEPMPEPTAEPVQEEPMQVDAHFDMSFDVNHRVADDPEEPQDT